jgi:hypothetical protein
LTAPWVIKGAINRDLFDANVETQPAPTLRRGDDALWQAVGTVCGLVSDEECYNYFKAAGYEVD